MRQAGVEVMILSNNRSPARVEQFCRELGITYEGHAKKPRTVGFRRAMARCGVTPKETAMLGDKLLTDMLGANRSGILALMVEPTAAARKARGTRCSTPYNGRGRRRRGKNRRRRQLFSPETLAKQVLIM